MGLFRVGDGGEEEGENKGGKKEGKEWVLSFRDLPEVARQRAVTSRSLADIHITAGDPMEFRKALDCSYVCIVRCLSFVDLL